MSPAEVIARVLDPDAFTGEGYGPEAAASSREDALDRAQEILAVAQPLIRAEVIEEVLEGIRGVGMDWAEDDAYADLYAAAIRGLIKP